MTICTRALSFFTLVVVATSTCRDDECVTINATDAARASSMLQVKASKVNIDYSTAAPRQGVGLLQGSRTCISNTLKVAHLQATRTHQERLAKQQLTNAHKLGHLLHGGSGGDNKTLHGKTPQDACAPINGLTTPSYRPPCSVDMGDDVPAKEGKCMGAAIAWCDVGQGGPPGDCDGVPPGGKCMFADIEGTCTVVSNSHVCDIWRPVEDKKILHGKTPQDACAPVNGLSASNPCSVDMGDGVPAIEGTCTGAAMSWCDVGQGGAPGDCDGVPPGSGGKCMFEDIEGTCTVVSNIVSNSIAPPPSHVCNIWPVRYPGDPDIAATGETPFAACSHLASYVHIRPEFDMSCKVSMGAEEAAKDGTCIGLTRGMWWCDLGQGATCQMFQYLGDDCTFLAQEGKCSKASTGHEYCNIWPVGDTVVIEQPNSLKEPVTQGSKVLPAVSNSVFVVGQEIIISEGTATEEFNKIVGFGSLILETPLKFDHGAGALVTAKVAEDSTTTTTPMTTPAPTTEVPATEAPATEAPATEAPTTEVPATEAPTTEVPATEAPATEAPATEAPTTEVPATEAPATEAPATEAPTTEVPATEAPTTEVPATEAPATEAPATDTTTTTTPMTTPAPTPAPTSTPTPAPPPPTTLTGATASLDAAGFKAATSLCCPSEMEQFFYRLLGLKGYSSCSNPHVQGLMHWFSCVPDMDFQYMLDVIADGNPCKYWAPIGTACPKLSPECAGNWCS